MRSALQLSSPDDAQSDDGTHGEITMKNKTGRYHVYASWTGIVDTYASLDAATRRAAKITAAPRGGRGVVVDSVTGQTVVE